MNKTHTRVPYNEKRLAFLDATLPYLILVDGRIVYNFEYYSTPTGTFIRELNEFDAPIIPARLWNFKGSDLTSYYNNIVEIEYDKAVVYAECQDYYDDGNEELWLSEVEAHYARVMELDNDICEDRLILEQAHAAEIAESKRRQDLLQRIADMTANDPDALPSPEVMQMRMDAGKNILADSFAPETVDSGIVVETPKIITNLSE